MVKIKKAEYILSAAWKSQWPEESFPEMCLAGRSNVGKSSFINTMLSRNGLAKVSSTPGKTRTLNFFNVNDALYFVDVPGYGYAKISKEIQAKWARMIERYLDTSNALRVVFLLVDIRHEPTAKDVETYQMLFKKGFNPLIIATKADKIKKNVRNKNISIIRKKLGLSQEVPVIPFSSATKEGKDEVWEYIEFFLNSQLL